MAYTKGRCFIDGQIQAIQSHHLIPLEYGGPKDGPQIDLCPTCHLTCHYEASLYYRTGAFEQLEVMFKGESLKRAKQVVAKIVEARGKFESHNEAAPDARRGVNLSFSHEELLLLHAMKKANGFRSLPRYLKALITKSILQDRRAKR